MRLALELKNVWNNVEIQKYKAFLAFFFFAEVKRSVKLQRQEKAAKIHLKKNQNQTSNLFQFNNCSTTGTSKHILKLLNTKMLHRQLIFGASRFKFKHLHSNIKQ